MEIEHGVGVSLTRDIFGDELIEMFELLLPDQVTRHTRTCISCCAERQVALSTRTRDAFASADSR